MRMGDDNAGTPVPPPHLDNWSKIATEGRAGLEQIARSRWTPYSVIALSLLVLFFTYLTWALPL